MPSKEPNNTDQLNTDPQPRETSVQGLIRMKRVWKRFNFSKEGVPGLLQQILSNINTLKAFQQDFVHRAVSRIERYIDDQERRIILDWIAPNKHISEHTAKQADILNRRQSGTGSWMLDTQEFKDWVQESSGSTLYCPGIPGAGKTFLFAILVDHLQKHARTDARKALVAYIFCSYDRPDDDENRLARTCLRMLAEQAPKVFNLLARAYKTRKPLEEIEIGSLFDYLGAALLLEDQVFILVDALDELRDYTPFLTRLLDTQQHSTLKLLFTARPINDIPAHFTQSSTINILAAQTDVREYVRQNVTKLGGVVRNKPALQGEITEVITQNVKGM